MLNGIGVGGIITLIIIIALFLSLVLKIVRHGVNSAKTIQEIRNDIDEIKKELKKIHSPK